MDGTFYLGEKPLEGALEFIDLLHQQGRDYLFLTNNSSKDSQQYAEKFARLGLAVSRDDKIMTFGEATAMHVQRQKPGVQASEIMKHRLPVRRCKNYCRGAEI